jgi:glycerate kinase
MVQELDRALAHWADITAQAIGHDHRQAAGAGAAGGLGFGAIAWLHARTEPGVQVVAQLTNLQSHIEDADLVLTGEGRLDRQTLAGKTPWGVMQLAATRNIPTIAIAGSLGVGYQDLYAAGLTAAFSLVSGPTTLESALQQAPELLEARTTDIIRLWLAGHHSKPAPTHRSIE